MANSNRHMRALVSIHVFCSPLLFLFFFPLLAFFLDAPRPTANTASEPGSCEIMVVILRTVLAALH